MIAPSPRRDPVTIVTHDRERVVDYPWLIPSNFDEVRNNPDKPELLDQAIRDHLNIENEYADEHFKETKSHHEAIYKEMCGRVEPYIDSVPCPDGPFEYYHRYEGGQYPIYARRARDDSTSAEKILLDCPKLSKESDVFHVAETSHSPDHTLFTWAEDRSGSEAYTVHVHRIEDGEPQCKPIENVEIWRTRVVLSIDGKFIYWLHKEENGHACKVFRRKLGADRSSDELVYEEADKRFDVRLQVTASRQYILINSVSKETTEVHVINQQDPDMSPKLFCPREFGVNYSLEHWGDQFVILTNADGAIDFKLCLTPMTKTGREYWRDWVPYRPGHYIKSMIALENYLVRLERINNQRRVFVLERGSKEEYEMSLNYNNEMATDNGIYMICLFEGYEYESVTLRYSYETPRKPEMILDYDLATKKTILRRTQKLPSGHNADEYEVRSLMIKSFDGAEIPVRALALAGSLEKGPLPTLLEAYSSYGGVLEPYFYIADLSLVDRGWLVVFAEPRGSIAKGGQWYLDGKLDKRNNTFEDYEAVANALIKMGLSQPDGIALNGSSAGGTLVGVAMNRSNLPLLAAVTDVPFVDVLSTLCNPSLPLTPTDWLELGNPLEDPEVYDQIAAYSVIDNITSRPYPPTLIFGGLHDNRVTFWEPTIFAGKLRSLTTSNNPVFLKIEMNGHFGQSGRYKRFEAISKKWAFLLWALKQRGYYQKSCQN